MRQKTSSKWEMPTRTAIPRRPREGRAIQFGGGAGGKTGQPGCSMEAREIVAAINSENRCNFSGNRCGN